jgi:prepilin-type N-terminal cleavage/methylation domain-containing protein
MGRPMKTRGFTLIELMIVIAIIAIIAAIAIPGLLSSQRASNERNASASLKTLCTAEADFRANDREGNHVNDFWTGNVAGLYTMTNAAIPGGGSLSTTDPAIKLIELSLASADGDSSTPSAGGENVALTYFAVPSAKAGYWYQAMVADSTLGSVAEASYQTDTNGIPNMGSVHNPWKFGFVAYPDSQSSGKFVYIVNEGNTIFRSATTGSVRPSTSSPPGTLTLTTYSNWPDDPTLKSYWSKLD